MFNGIKFTFIICCVLLTSWSCSTPKTHIQKSQQVIVIDPGHGGRDYGVPGYFKGIFEKNVNIDIAKRLSVKLQSELDYHVILTRENDEYLSLEDRSTIANENNANIFISIHTNYSKDKKQHGIETYYLNISKENDSGEVAMMENKDTTKDLTELQSILKTLIQDENRDGSSRLAALIQKSICMNLEDKGYNHIKNRGVNEALFFVLLKTQMPAVLVEISYLTNPRECKRLLNEKYQDALCEGIVIGIKKYLTN